MVSMTMLRMACFFPAAVSALQAFTASSELGSCKPSHATPKRLLGECYKLVKPQLLFIGQAHSGSTSLFELMNNFHPNIKGNIKEHHFFDGAYKKQSSNPDKSLHDYMLQFCVPCNTTIGVDATMEYINIARSKYGGRAAVQKVRTQLGSNLKIMLMVRDPVELLFSKQCQGNPNPKRPFEADSPPNISASEITLVEPLSVWRDVFPDEKNWLILRSEDFFANQQKVMNKVFQFLGVEPVNVVAMSKNETDHQGNLVAASGRRRCTIEPKSAERKAFHSREDNVNDHKQLEKITRMKFYWPTA